MGIKFPVRIHKDEVEWGYDLIDGADCVFAENIGKEDAEQIVNALNRVEVTTPKTSLNFQGNRSIEIEWKWGGCNLLDFDGRLWRVDNAVYRSNGCVDIFAHQVGDELARDMRAAWAAWGEKKSEEEVND